MLAYVINLPSAKERWAWIERSFSATGLTLQRVPAVDGNACQLPHPDFAEKTFHRIHGRTTNLGELGCYLSHVTAMRAFLTTHETHALICEDDIELSAEFGEVLDRAMAFARYWNLLRVTGLKPGMSAKVAQLDGTHALHVNFQRLKGTGAYVVDRKAAEQLSKHLLPMKLPYDHALDREWVYGLRALTVLPFPIDQTGRLFRSSIQNRKAGKLPTARRVLFTYPYQVWNELCRWTFRGAQYASLRAQLSAG